MPSSSSTPPSMRYHEPRMINYCSWNTWVEMLRLFNGPYHCSSDRLVIHLRYVSWEIVQQESIPLPFWFCSFPPHCDLKVKEYLHVRHLIFGHFSFIYSDFNALFFLGTSVLTHAWLFSYMSIVSLFLHFFKIYIFIYL